MAASLKEDLNLVTIDAVYLVYKKRTPILPPNHIFKLISLL